MGKITAFCSKNTTEFSEISRWRWSECWGGDSPARHCRFVPATVKTVPANVGERHAAPGDALAVRTNRRQNGNSLRFVIARRPQADVAISGRQLRFRRKCPVIHPGSARLHPKGTSSRFAPRAPRRFAPRNDTSGWFRGAPAPLRGLMLLHKAVTDRHAGWQCCGIDSLARGSLNCHCEEAAGRRGNLGKAVTFSPEVSCYPPRFCEIATGAKRPRNDTSGWCRGAPAPLRGLMLLHKAVTDRRYSQTWRRVRSAMACTGCKCLPEIAPQGHFLALRAQGATSLRSSQ